MLKNKAIIVYHAEVGVYTILFDRKSVAWEETYEQAVTVRQLIEGNL